MGVEKSLAQTAVRISLDLDNDMSRMEQFLTTFKIIYEKNQKSKVNNALFRNYGTLR